MTSNNEINRRTILEKRMVIGSDPAWVSREGGTIKITYGYAGRFSKEPQTFYVEDILALAEFIRETDAA